MRIAIMLPFYPTLNDGLPSYSRWLVQSLSKKHEVFVLVPCARNSLKRTGELIDGAKIYDFYIPMPFSRESPFKTIIRWFLDFPRCFFEFRRFLNNKVDTVQTTFHSYNYFLLINNLFGGVPYMVTLHGSESVFFDKIPFQHRILSQYVISGASQVIVVSKTLQDIVISKFPKLNKIDVVHNGINPTPIKDLDSARLKLDNVGLKNSYCIIIARLHPVKGIDVAIKAWSHLIKNNQHKHLIIVGGGDQLDEYHNQAEDLGCSNFVHFFGPCSNAEVHGLLSFADIMILPSRSEGLGGVLLEAGVAGVPVVATRVGGIPEVVTDGQDGFLVPSEDSIALADATLKLLTNEQLRHEFGQNFRNKVLSNFNSGRLANSYARLLSNIIGQ